MIKEGMKGREEGRKEGKGKEENKRERTVGKRHD